MYRIGIAFFYHESHSFTATKTNMKDFYNEGYFKGEAIFSAYTGTKTEVGGFIDVLSKYKEVEIVPLLCAAAIPSGVVTHDTYRHIEEEMLDSLRNAGILDGILIALHGAMVVDGLFDPEEHLLRKIRSLAGPRIPIATTLDMHANLNESILQYTPYHFGFKTYPHIDMYEQGVRAASALMDHIQDINQYEAAFIKMPMILPSVNMRTIQGPMAEVIKLTNEYEGISGIKNISVFGGFPYSDIPSAGASVLVIAETKNLAEEYAKKIARYYWRKREEFLVKLPNVQEAIELAFSMNEPRPIVLADIADNPMSCGSGDTTLLLAEFLKKNHEHTLFGGLTDPESIKKCNKAGLGSTVFLSLGGNTSPEFGKPVKIEAEVIGLSDGIFYNSGPFNHQLKMDLKGAAHIRVGHVDVLLIGRPMSANDPEMFRHIGIEPTNYKIMALKAKNHFRAAFDPLISKVIYVDAPGVAANDLRYFSYQYIPSKIWPLTEAKFEV